MRYFILVFGFIVGAILFHSCKEQSEKVIKTEPVAFKKEGELTLLKAETDSVVSKLNIEIADNEYETETGLMYRQGMENNQGMLFVFPDQAMHSFYMKNTEFPLDIIFIKSDMSVASVQENAQPLSETSLSSKVPVQYVLEVNAGLVGKWALEIGDKMEFRKE
ncbi:MAG TPA: DUF192 domain-containing protein [Pricia sp.]|nr:DUF192 domain-containing protein [Pricia sp.]